MYGGLSPELSSMGQIQKIMRPTDIHEHGLLCDLLWADPDRKNNGWNKSDRGISSVFEPDIVSEFVKKHGLDLICQTHECVENGYEFFANLQLLTLFSAPNHCGMFETTRLCYRSTRI